MASVDILMPAYNAAATIGEAIDSLRDQSVRDIRIIVVDDGSIDETPAILADIAAREPRLVVVTKANAGIVEARNDALRHAEADIIACLDSDDIALPGRLERTLAYLHAHPECVAVGGAVEHIDVEGAPLSGLPPPSDPAGANAAAAPAVEPYIIQSTLMARRADVVAVGGYRHVPNSEDSDLYWRLASHGSLVNLPDKLSKYRVHTSSMSSSLHTGRIMAVGSQLGALSALRRQAGRADFAFPRGLHDALNRASSLAEMFEVASCDVDAAEARHLHIAIACKLMEMARYRPFEPDRADCDFIRASLPFAGSLGAQNQREVTWYVTVTGARLIRKGMFAEASALMQAKHFPVAAARLLVGQ